MRPARRLRLGPLPLAVALLAGLACHGGAAAQAGQPAPPVAGSTAASVTLTETHEIALGWSVKRSILGQTVYTEAGEKIGEVQDMIVAPNRQVSYLIIGAGGFLGIGRHDVAVATHQVRTHAGRLEMPGATRDTLRMVPRFDYAESTAVRDHFVAHAELDLVAARARITSLQASAASANAEARVRIDAQVARLRQDLAATEKGLAELQQAGASQWRRFEDTVSDLGAQLRKSVEAAVG